MANIKILQTPDFLDTSIPAGCVPQRFAIATNILLCAVIKEEKKGLLLFNYEPKKWNQWYPYFSSVNDIYSFDGVTYGDLVNIFKKDILARADVQARVAKAENAFLELLGVSDGHISLSSSLIAPEMWLKYSKTQNIWTFYYMEFFKVDYLPKVDFEVLDHSVIEFLPLTDVVIDEVLKTGKYRGIDVVDNTLDIIKSKYILNDLISSAIMLS